jgi:arylsulfatase A-like enzyme
VRGCVAASLLTASMVFATTASAARAGEPLAVQREGARRPNIVFVLVDDLDETGGPYWKAMPKTRALVADRGTVFTNAFATNPLCCPARATILTGQYTHNNGVWSVYEQSIGDAEQRTLAVRLGDAGYTTGFAGKYLNGYERRPDRVPPGWDEWFGLAGRFLGGYGYEANHNGTIETFGRAKRDYQTDVLTREALSFIDDTEADDAQPFFLHLTPSAGHWPMRPARRHTDNRFADDPLPRRPNFDEADIADKPLWLRDGVPSLDAAAVENETERYRRAMGSLLAVDDMVDAVARRLRALGELEDTIFVFSSDNGYNRGAHRLREKAAPYDESTRVPLAIAGPGIDQGTVRRLVGHVDYAPTLLELAGVEIPDDVDGQSFVSLLRGDDAPVRRDLLVEFRGEYGGLVLLDTRQDVENALAAEGLGRLTPTYRAIRTIRWLYVEWYAGDAHEYELYDLRADPYQLENLLAQPEATAEHAQITARLQARLEQLATCAGASCR